MVKKWNDDRTSEQRETHTLIVAADDKYMSRFGHGERLGGSVAAWACKSEDGQKVLDWVKARPEMHNVRVTNTIDLCRDAVGHVHVYFVWPGHVALRD